MAEAAVSEAAVSEPGPEAGAERVLRAAARGLGLAAGRGAAGAALQGFLRGAAPALLAWRGPDGHLALGPPPPPARRKALFFLRGPGPGEPLCGDLPADILPHFAALLEEVSSGQARAEPAAAGRTGSSAPHPSGCAQPVRPGQGILGKGRVLPLGRDNPLQQEEVIVPILTNKNNHQGWPKVVSQDLTRHVHKLRSTVFKVLGQVKGKTLLPLPAGSEGIEDIDLGSEKCLELVDKSLVRAAESAILDWSCQIQETLKKESLEPLLQGRNPNPKVELEFWKSRCEDLECIYHQLRTRRVRNMLGVLERVESSYVPVFKAVLMDVEAALSEAQDIHLHLAPLRRHLEGIEAVEFSKVKPLLLPLLHVVCLIWVSCKNYSTPMKIVVLLQEICNLLIQQAQVYLAPEDLLKGEMEESLSKVQTVLSILNGFKGAFEERREQLHTYYEPGQEVRLWDFHASMVFARLDSFLRKLQMVEGLLTTALDLRKLEKLEFSGVKGKALGQQVLDMYEEFQEAYKVFAERTYNCLDLANMEFEQDAFAFQQKVEDIDLRLGTVFSQAFNDASDLEHTFKLLDMFGSLLQRPAIAADAADKFSLLLHMVSSALDHARLLYSRHIKAEQELGRAPVHKNMPPVAGAVCWAQELRARIQLPLGHLRSLPRPCLDPAEERRVLEKYEGLIQLLDRYQEQLYRDWSQAVSEQSQHSLTQPLLRRDPDTKLLAVNFDPQLVSVLREVRYLSGSQLGAIPPTAAEIYSCKDSYRQMVASLELMVNRYNKVLQTVLEVEYPLIQGQLQEIDLKLRAAEETLNWKTEGELALS
ncbi:dynein axonemal heavy chain 9-like [Pogoniulus pusillus]|uniref:dynein axonemal heavy chain 9-like n=1 Tax=Pogoniulus pusillus TaxID=488313 RepID=UPI0030B953D3